MQTPQKGKRNRYMAYFKSLALFALMVIYLDIDFNYSSLFITSFNDLNWQAKIFKIHIQSN